MRWLAIALLVVCAVPAPAGAQGTPWTYDMTAHRMRLQVPAKDEWALRWLGRAEYTRRADKDAPALWVRHPASAKLPKLVVRMDFESPGTYHFERDSYIAAAGRWYATDGDGKRYDHYGQKLGEKTQTIGKIAYTKVYWQWNINDAVTRRHRNVIFVFFEYGFAWRGYGMFANNEYRWISGHSTNFAEVSEEMVDAFLARLSALEGVGS